MTAIIREKKTSLFQSASVIQMAKVSHNIRYILRSPKTGKLIKLVPFCNVCFGLMSQDLNLDLVLKYVINNQDFDSNNEENWKEIQKICKRESVKEIKDRFKQLLDYPPEWLLMQKIPSRTDNFTLKSRDKHHSLMKDISQRPSSSSLGKRNMIRDESVVDTDGRHNLKPISARGPTMVIHVCDEAKGVKQDFYCPRDLLVKEMRYFAEYLSVDQQRLEEVDISVHCDVNIFDWLMRYVKRDTCPPGSFSPVSSHTDNIDNKSEERSDPTSSVSSASSVALTHLQATNVVSILISSDFLKMDTLVDICIDYCKDNMNDVLLAPCNMNCINDKLVSRIAEKFTDEEADAIKDKKDKFKNKIFMKKIERLFDQNFKSEECPENASTLFKCFHCERLLTASMEKKARCIHSRISVDHRGDLVSRHVPDKKWDVTDYILELKEKLSSWRDVYWRLWGSILNFTCEKCGDCFTGSEYKNCRRHTQNPKSNENRPNEDFPEDIYPCCKMRAYKFNWLDDTTGCETTNHIIQESGDPSENVIESSGSYYSKKQLLNILLNHTDIICVPPSRTLLHPPQLEMINIFESEKLIYDPSKRNDFLSEDSDVSISLPKDGPKLQPLTFDGDDDDSSASDDDEVGDDEVTKAQLRPNRVTIQKEAILMDGPQFLTKKTKKWDVNKSLRANQDAQRQEDLRRTKQMIEYLTKLRLNMDKSDKSKPKEVFEEVVRLKIVYGFNALLKHIEMKYKLF